MTQQPWDAVETYLSDLFEGDDLVTSSALAKAEEAGLPPHNVTSLEAKFLYLLARAGGVCSILEIGTLAGFSTIWLARALPENGRLITLEADARHAAVARANLERAGLAGIVEIREGIALETLPRLAEEGAGPFDMIFIDADKENNPSYLEWALQLTRVGSLIVADNVVRAGAVVDPAAQDPSVVGVRRFNELVAADSRLDATVLQTVGSKGHDGMLIARVVGGSV